MHCGRLKLREVYSLFFVGRARRCGSNTRLTGCLATAMAQTEMAGKKDEGEPHVAVCVIDIWLK